VTDH
jgi:hypothetical protein